MSEIGLSINVDSYNNEGIKTIKGNNNAEIYKLYILKNKRRLSLVGKTVKLGYVMAGTTKGDIIENLNITNAEQGEITFPITNRISKQDGVYSCQLAIYGADGFLEHTATFGLTVEDNIFTKIAGEIADSKDFTYLENILDKASKLSEKLKENTSTATNANSNLESNITEANNINSKLLENTSTATSLNKNLESNIDLAKEVKETIKDLDTKNIEATEKIQTLTGLNSKAEELSNNINKGLPLNSELIKNVESAKTANNELIATNNDAKAKKTDLDNSLEEAKKYIAGLDGSQNIPQIRLDVDALQNGLKSNQALSYEGSSIVANETLEGRTEGMRIKGRSLLNLIKDGKGTFVIDKNKNQDMRIYTFKLNHNLVRGKKYVGYIQVNSMENVTSGLRIYGWSSKTGVNGGYFTCANNVGVVKFKWNTSVFPENVGEIDNLYLYVEGNEFNNGAKLTFSNFMLFEEGTDLTYIDEYFEGLKSFGEAEKEGDKYKISILSSGKNIYNWEDLYIYKPEEKWRVIKVPNIPKFELGKTYKVSYKTTESVALKIILTYENGEDAYSSSESPLVIAKNKGKITGFRFYIEESDYSTNKKFIITNIQIEEGSQATIYEPYKEDKKDILIKEPLKEREYIYEDNGQVKVYRPTKQYTFTGNETSIIKWATVKDENFIGFYITNDDIPNLTSKRSLVVCNNFPSVDGVITKRNMYIAANSVNICIEKSALATPDIEGFRAWLKANPTTIVYQLAEPVVEIVENCVDIDLDTFVEKTYFNILNSLPGSLDFKVPSNIASIVQNTAREVNNIWDVINNLLVPGILDVNKKVALATIKK